MNTTQQRHAELWVLMQFRRLGFGRNHLRRGVDRAEALLLLGVLFAGLLLVPVAAAFGTWVSSSSEQGAAQRRAELRSAQAATLEDTTMAVPVGPGQTATRVRVRWTDEMGVPHEGQTNVVVGTKAGSPVTVWLDRTGAIVAPPRQPQDSAALGAGAGMLLVMIGWPLLGGVFRLLRVPLDRSRYRAWEREWAETAPRWKKSQW